MAAEEDSVVIKKGPVTINCFRSDLIMVDQTPDGVVINLKGGLALNYTDQYMEIETKERIKQAVNHMAGNLEIDLGNRRTPARILGK